MKLLDAYTGQRVAASLMLVLLVLLGVVTVFRFIGELDTLDATYGFFEVISYVALTTPRHIYDLIPYCTMIAALLGLGGLARNSELVVMRASGVSVFRISWGALRPILVLVFIGVLLGEFVVPPTERWAQRLKVENRTLAEARDDSEWYREGNVFVHFGIVYLGGNVEHLSIYEFDVVHRLRRSLYAARGVHHQPHPDDSYWLLEDVRITELSSSGTSTQQLQSWRWDSSIDPAILESRASIDSSKLSLAELSRKISYFSGQDMSTGSYRLAFWSKVLQPLATLSLVFIAISFIFGPLRGAGVGWQLVVGLLTGIIFKFMQDLLSPASLVFGFSPLLAAALPVAVCLAAGALLLARTR